MNFGIGRSYSVLLMSVRRGAPYSDDIDRRTGTLTYEGHDVYRTRNGPDPKMVDQPMTTPNGSWRESRKIRQLETGDYSV